MLDDDSHDEINNEEDDDVDYALAEHINETLNYLMLLEEKRSSGSHSVGNLYFKSG